MLYVVQELAYAKKMMLDRDLDGSSCKMRFYFKVYPLLKRKVSYTSSLRPHTLVAPDSVGSACKYVEVYPLLKPPPLSYQQLNIYSL